MNLDSGEGRDYKRSFFCIHRVEMQGPAVCGFKRPVELESNTHCAMDLFIHAGKDRSMCRYEGHGLGGGTRAHKVHKLGSGTRAHEVHKGC